ncbi:MAG: TonB family protein [Gammaproteobacteria bacterium]|nr:MAG: TonB family protein [Gammaproteobacteria bacterium]
MHHLSSTPHLPAGYRFLLALSSALLVHILILSGLPFPSSKPEPPHNTIQVALATASPASKASKATTATTPPTNRNPEFKIPIPDKTPPDTTAKPRVSRSAKSPDLAETRSKPASQKPQSRPQISSTRTPAPDTSSEQMTPRTREQAPSPNENLAKDQNTLTSEAPVKQDPYVALLAVQLAKATEGMRGIAKASNEASKTGESVVTVEVELGLLDNGALTQARIVKSSGDKRIDKAAYRAALAASPYPAPPAGNKAKNRFVVELKLAPERL